MEEKEEIEKYRRERYRVDVEKISEILDMGVKEARAWALFAAFSPLIMMGVYAGLEMMGAKIPKEVYFPAALSAAAAGLKKISDRYKP